MTKEKIYELYLNLSTLKELKGVKFGYAVAKNMSTLKPEVEALEKSKEPSEEYSTYEAERIELAKKCSKKDEKGEPVVETKNGVSSFVLEDLEKFNKEISKLQKTHKDAIEKREAQIKDFQELLKTETTIELHRIKLADIPEEITTEQMKGIYDIIEE